jgi:methylase of polypeptide subunit release factors
VRRFHYRQRRCAKASHRLNHSSMASARDERHRYGQHYTPDIVARLLAAFSVRQPRDEIFDPSCGDGRLLLAALQQKESLDASDYGRATLISDLFGIDRSAEAVDVARLSLTRIAVRDFFDLAPGSRIDDFSLPASFDAIIGNPPYIRQEVMGREDKARVSAALARARRESPSISWPDFSRRSDIYVFFFAQATRFLRERGRLVFITASSWLDVEYGAALRDFLLNNYRIIALIESAAESLFEDASINTAITVLEREPVLERRAENQIRFVKLSEPLTAQPRNLAGLIESANDSAECRSFAIRVIGQSDLLAGSRRSESWGRYMRAEDVFFAVMKKGTETLKPLAEMARVRFGVKTGANEFFYLADRQCEAPCADGLQEHQGLRPLAEVATVRRGLTTGANEFFYLKPFELEQITRVAKGKRDAGAIELSQLGLSLVEDGSGARHWIEARFLSPIVFSLKQISSIVLRHSPAEKLFFNCALQIDDLEDTRALEYIRKGEKAGYHARPSCAGREPWYALARNLRPAPLLLPSKIGERWLVALNTAAVFEDKKLYGVFPGDGVADRVLAALLNSTWARYYTEITCRQMTGAQAIADIDVRVASQMMIPDPRLLTDQMKADLESALAAISDRPIGSIFVEVNREDRRRLDDLVLKAIGFVRSRERSAVLAKLYRATTELVRRRLDRSRRM